MDVNVSVCIDIRGHLPVVVGITRRFHPISSLSAAGRYWLPSVRTSACPKFFFPNIKNAQTVAVLYQMQKEQGKM